MFSCCTFVAYCLSVECEYRQAFGQQATANEQIDDEPDDSGAETRDSPDGTEQQQDAPAAAMEGSCKHVDEARHERDHRTSRFSHASSTTSSFTQTLSIVVSILIACLCSQR